MTCTVERRADAAIVHACDQVDVANAAELREAFIDLFAEKVPAHLVVDLAEVNFIDSTGIGVVVGAHRRVVAAGGRFTVVVATPPVRKVLQITGLLRAWRVVASVEDALDDV